jgi:ATP-dependent DNA helicase RecG
VPVAKITVPKAHGEVATQAGVYVRRCIKHDGTPECVPMLPHERISRASNFGLLLRPSKVLSGISNPAILEVAHNSLRSFLQHRHMLVGGLA